VADRYELGQRRVLERIARSDDLGEVLADVTKLIEQQSDDLLCSILLVDDDGLRVRNGASPSLPAEFVATLDGLAIGPTAGSCGAAAFLGQRVIVEDIATHPNWTPYRHLATPFGLRACWSSPIVSPTGEVLGTFAIYYRDARGPSEREVAWVDEATHLASVAIMRVRTDDRLRRTEALRALIYDSVEDVVFYVGIEGPRLYRFLSVNPAFERATGLKAAAVVGREVTEVIPPSSHELVLGKYAEAIATRAKVVWEEVSQYPSGTKYGEVTISPAFDADGRCTNLVGTVHDVTQRVTAERERQVLETKLSQAQRLQALGTLAGGVAHDFNNVLSVILSYSELAREELQPGEPMRDTMDEIHTAAMRATEMTRQLLAFSRQQVLEPKVLNLNKALAGMDRLLQRLLGADVVLTTLAEPGLANVRADPGQLEQIVMNLAVNARDAMPQGGRLTIETSNVVLDEDCARKHVEVQPGRHVMLAVTDTGSGMDAATQARIFEPFFTTKEKGKGTGLGLATVFGIVRQSGGNVWVYSEPGRGTTFKIYLPVVDEESEVVGPSKAPSEVPRGTETVLLVEDDDQVRALAREILRARGYLVLEASNGGEALLICEQHGGQVDLLLTDVVMPRMSGRQLADRLRQLRPAMKVLFMSGYTDDAILHHGVLNSGVHYLQKPITPLALLRRVREALER
jgi:two-component system, cell cycle sensor histidine kinase and response regulator CckA